MKNIVLILLSLFMISNSHAYLIAKYGSSEAIDYSAKSQIMVIGFAGELQNQFMESAYFRAKLYRKLYPSTQVIFIRPLEGSESEARKKTELPNVHVIELNYYSLKAQRLINWLKKFSAIKSLDFFGHSSPVLGVGLEGYAPDQRISHKSPGVEALANSFLKDESYVILHGCNSGFAMAPAFASMWSLPVMGSYTGTDFQQWSTKDSHWYFNNPGHHPEPPAWKYCEVAFCKRMKSQETPYSGTWGNYDIGLNFYKTSCSKNQSIEICEKLMAEALLAYLSQKTMNGIKNINDFAQAAEDFICPINLSNNVRGECVRAIRNAAQGGPRSYSAFPGKTAKCDAYRCDVEVVCDESNGNIDPKSCKTVGADNPYPTEYADEYLRYLRGYQHL